MAPATTAASGPKTSTSRILVVADIYDALSADRPYHEAMPQEKILGILREESATRIDPNASPSSKT